MQHYYYTDYIPCAVLFITLTPLFYDWKFVPLNLCSLCSLFLDGLFPMLYFSPLWLIYFLIGSLFMLLPLSEMSRFPFSDCSNFPPFFSKSIAVPVPPGETLQLLLDKPNHADPCMSFWIPSTSLVSLVLSDIAVLVHWVMGSRGKTVLFMCVSPASWAVPVSETIPFVFTYHRIHVWGSQWIHLTLPSLHGYQWHGFFLPMDLNFHLQIFMNYFSP